MATVYGSRICADSTSTVIVHAVMVGFYGILCTTFQHHILFCSVSFSPLLFQPFLYPTVTFKKIQFYKNSSQFLYYFAICYYHTVFLYIPYGSDHSVFPHFLWLTWLSIILFCCIHIVFNCIILFFFLIDKQYSILNLFQNYFHNTVFYPIIYSGSFELFPDVGCSE